MMPTKYLISREIILMEIDAAHLTPDEALLEETDTEQRLAEDLPIIPSPDLEWILERLK